MDIYKAQKALGEMVNISKSLPTLDGAKHFEEKLLSHIAEASEKYVLETLIEEGYVYDYKHESDKRLSKNELEDIIQNHYVNVTGNHLMDAKQTTLFVSPTLNNRIELGETNINGTLHELCGAQFCWTHKVPEDTVRVIVVDPKYVKKLSDSMQSFILASMNEETNGLKN